MPNQILVLPVGGSASRMQGLPKFLLPFDSESVLIEKHITAALDNEFSKVVVIVRDNFFEITSLYLSKFDSRVQIIKLDVRTKTMCETLLLGLKGMKFTLEDQIVVALADTAFSRIQYQEIYSKALTLTSDPQLILFEGTEEQFGKLGQVEIDQHENVTAMKDKVPGCRFKFFWGIASFPYSLFERVDEIEAHIGISIQKWLDDGLVVKGIPVNSLYFDCGTFSEYRRFMNSNAMD